MAKVENYFKYNTFLSLLKDSHKYYELYDSFAAKISFILTVMSVGCLWYLLVTIDIEIVNGLLKNMLLTLAAGLIGLLGFLITGLAMMTTVVTQKTINKLDEMDSIEDLVEVLYSFYFEGGMVGVTIAGLVLTYLFIHIQAETIHWLYLLWSVFLSYFFWFSITYSIGLLGTCINIFFANLVYSVDHKEHVDENIKK